MYKETKCPVCYATMIGQIQGDQVVYKCATHPLTSYLDNQTTSTGMVRPVLFAGQSE